ncbi:MAG: NAD-dependent deacetylase [Variibacter sp.]
MIMTNAAHAVARLQELFEGAQCILPFTGAGISTECGIPDFRSPGGIWTRMAPIPFEDFIASQEMRDETWRRRFVMEEQFTAARPGRGHRALAALHHRGKAPEIITQNIDNLHQMSGVPDSRVVELHGNTTYALCLDCAKRFDLAWVKAQCEARQGRAPDCECGGFIKTATISFGQAMPEEPMRRAKELTLSCDLFLAIGSSLVVWPAAGFPLMAKRNGARLVIINREATEFDAMADLVVRDDIGEILAPFITQ